MKAKKRYLFMFLMIFTIIFTSTNISNASNKSILSNIGIDIEKYEPTISYETDKGIEFNLDGKTEYLDLGVDKIKFDFKLEKAYNYNKGKEDMNIKFRVRNNSKYPLIASSVNMYRDSDYQSYVNKGTSDTILPNKEYPLGYKGYDITLDDGYKIESYEYMAIKGDYKYHVIYDIATKKYTTRVIPIEKNENVKSTKEGLKFYIDKKEEVLDTSIDKLKFNIQKTKNNALYETKFSFKNNSKNPILSMAVRYIQKEKNNDIYVNYKDMQYITVFQNQDSPYIKLDTSILDDIEILEYNYKVFYNEAVYEIKYNTRLDSYKLISKTKVSKNTQKGIEFTLENGEKTYLNFGVENIEFISDTNQKSTIGSKLKIKNNLDFNIDNIDFGLLRKNDNMFLKGVVHNMVFAKETEDNVLMNIFFNEKNKDYVYEILYYYYQVTDPDYTKSYLIDYYPKLDRYIVSKVKMD